MARWLLVVLGLSGCAAPLAVEPRARRAEETVRVAPQSVDESPLAEPVAADAPSPSFSEPPQKTHVIGGAPREPTQRPAVHRTIDVNLRQAKTSDALQFIADAGGFNVVVDGELSAPVTVMLRRVDAFDALMVVAQAQGLGVSLERGIVMIGARGGPR